MWGRIAVGCFPQIAKSRSSRPTIFSVGNRPTKTTGTPNTSTGVFDHSAWIAEHLPEFLVGTKRGIFRPFRAIAPLFDIFLSNAAPTVMRVALRGLENVGVSDYGNA